MSQHDWILDDFDTFPDFPIAGVQFLWYRKLLANPIHFAKLIDSLAERYQNFALDSIGALDARGFIFASPLALKLNKPLLLFRKPGKLPGRLRQRSYQLEYGQTSLELEEDSVQVGQRVLLLDDIIATGGTLACAAQLVEELGGKVAEITGILALNGLGWEQQLKHWSVYAMVRR